MHLTMQLMSMSHSRCVGGAGWESNVFFLCKARLTEPPPQKVHAAGVTNEIDGATVLPEEAGDGRWAHHV